MPNSEIKEFNILITGVGGQGVVLTATIIANAGLKKGLKIRTADTFGAAQRGGPVLSHVRFGSQVFGPLIPSGKCDVLIGLEPIEALRFSEKYLSSSSNVIINSKPIYPIDVATGRAIYPSIKEIYDSLKMITKNIIPIDATERAIKLGDKIYSNILLLGILAESKISPLDDNDLRESIEMTIPKSQLNINLKAFQLGQEIMQKNDFLKIK
jgi:indolepyruvate ferredoxin oxidoreductase beta subunit